jgi:tryptophan 2-monooxygenase
MAHIPNLRRPRAKLAPTSFPYIDNLFDYGPFLAGARERIGTLPEELSNEPIAVIGSGMGGLTAAYELCRAGARNVTIFEATSRSGGRTYSRPFTTGRPQFLAELGAMRFPPSEFGLFHYLDTFGIKHTPNFPDPGKVLTNIGYQGRTYVWKPEDKNPPALFTRVSNGWDHFVSDGCVLPSGVRLPSPVSITQQLEAGQREAAIAAWKSYIAVFENVSFYSGLVTIFTAPQPPGGERWQASDFELFGALGLGSGGFGPLYQIGFMELLRLIVNELETDQQLVMGGIESLARAFAEQRTLGVRLGDRIRYDTVVKRISRGADRKPVLELSHGRTERFSRVVVAATNRSMNVDMDLGYDLGVLDANQRSSVSQVHMTNSSKVFVMTRAKFWLTEKNLPANIQTDTLVRGVYCLDYAPGDLDAPGVVLLSYTWEDDSTTQMALGDKRTRVKRLVEDVGRTNPDFARHVVPIDNDYSAYTQVIDWQLEPHYYGAFKLNFPGNDQLSRTLFYQYLTCKTPAADPFVYLAGDSQSFTGGWIEGAVQTGVNAACAVIRSLGGSLYTPDNPIDTAQPTTYDYSPK